MNNENAEEEKPIFLGKTDIKKCLPFSAIGKLVLAMVNHVCAAPYYKQKVLFCGQMSSFMEQVSAALFSREYPMC